MPDDPEGVMPEEHYDPPEETVNTVGPDTWDSATPRALDDDQEPVSRFPGKVDYPYEAGA